MTRPNAMEIGRQVRALSLRADETAAHPTADALGETDDLATHSAILGILIWAAEHAPPGWEAEAAGLGAQLEGLDVARGPEGALKALTKMTGPIPLSLLTEGDPQTVAHNLAIHVLEIAAEKEEAEDA